ncbi:conserved Plasmodium protein, unknown function [Plasmodium yoelii]|nr:conserved Plasmodium protein, unknown function [Plasmodium yoelii]CDU19944.1 conserved Plasmodium protein, unknown function [Plasmodium yoelii]VTZ80702.1 conserved Plasmodium protein, unknown function [Plasmodium yoelii]|eukprot:XP_727945.2 conserved Plasmodium protein, unknown function [Plasmodium yoelii]
MKKRIENIQINDEKKKNNLKNIGEKNEKGKIKIKKKKIPKIKIENEAKVEDIEKKNDILDNVRISTYDEYDDKLINKMGSYIETTKEGIETNLFKKYYSLNKNVPLFYIDINIYKCVYNSFFTKYIHNKELNDTHNGVNYKIKSLYFYNILNSKSINIIYHFFKEFFKEYELSSFQNCCEMFQMTYLFFFILFTDYYTISPNMRSYCLENFKILFILKNYLFKKYIKYTNKILFKKYILLNQLENDIKKNDFFTIENSIITEILNSNDKIQFETATLYMTPSKKTYNMHFVSLLIKNKSYEYINNHIFIDLFKINIFTNQSSLSNSSLDASTKNTEKVENCFGENNNTHFSKANTINLLPIDETNNICSYVFEIEIPSYIYNDHCMEIFYVQVNQNVKQLNLSAPEKFLHLNKKNEIGETVFIDNMNDTINDDDQVEQKTNNCIEDEKYNKNEYDTLNSHDKINLIKIESEQVSINNKPYLKIYNNKVGNYYISLNSISNFPYTKWEITYIQNTVIIKIQSKIANQFIFHINNDGIILQDNGIGVLSDIFNQPLDVYALLFLMKKRGINLLVTDVEIGKMKKKYDYDFNFDNTEESIINDILLCFRFINFYSSNIKTVESKTTINIKGNANFPNNPFTDLIFMEYESRFCRISKMENEECEKRHGKNLSKHKSILFCLFELCELMLLNNNKKEKKTLNEFNKQENDEEDTKQHIMMFQYFLTKILKHNNIEKINKVVKENMNLKNISLQSDHYDQFSKIEYIDFLQLDQTTYYLNLFLKFTKIISFTDI